MDGETKIQTFKYGTGKILPVHWVSRAAEASTFPPLFACISIGVGVGVVGGKVWEEFLGGADEAECQRKSRRRHS